MPDFAGIWVLSYGITSVLRLSYSGQTVVRQPLDGRKTRFWRPANSSTGAKAHFSFLSFEARLKSCPSYKQQVSVAPNSTHDADEGVQLPFLGLIVTFPALKIESWGTPCSW
jgi:hypothetical protein